MKILLIGLILSLSSFSKNLEKDLNLTGEMVAFNGDYYSAEEFKEIEDFKALVIETNRWRTAAIEFLSELAANPEKAISSDELSRIHNDGTLAYKKLRARYYNSYINPAKYMSEVKSKNVHFFEDRLSGKYKRNDWFTESFKDGEFIIRYLLRDRSEQLNFDMCDEDGRDLSLKFKLGLASAFILYDNYTLVISQFSHLKKLSRIINKDNSKIENFLKEVEDQYSDFGNYKSMVRTVETYDKMIAKMNTMSIPVSSFEKFVDATIQSSYLYSKRNEINSKTFWEAKKAQIWKSIKDRLNYKTSKVTSKLSKAFGNSVGLVATRKGKMIDMDSNRFSSLVKNIKSQLRPMDILLEKTPFRLTDKFIPGHWGHVAVWIGTETELKSMIDSEGNSLWSSLNPEFQKDILNGKNIIEALRPGVQVNSLEHFLNVDDLAVVRPNFMPKLGSQAYIEKLKYYLVRANEQYGKDYDFNFDVETDKTIVCSEIAYVIFTDKELIWPLDKAVGRYTISPDHVAEKAVSSVSSKTNFSFTPVVLYHDGKKVESSKIQRVFERLLEEDYDNL